MCNRSFFTMPSNLNFDHRLLDEAKKLGGFKYKKDASNAALSEYVNRHKQAQIRKHFDSITYESDYDYKKSRSRNIF
jgi:hypothetical protein